MRTLNWYIAALASIAIEAVLSAKVPVTSCPLNHYAVLNDDGSGISACLVCDSCSPGYGVVRPCSPTENTVCGLCEMGMFSTTMSDTDSCKPCQSCQDVGMVKECSPIADAVCKEQCRFGEFYNPTTLICEQCSYCFPDRPYAQTARVLDCQRQGLHIDYQCLPLPGTDAVVHPRVVTADRQRSATAARRHRGRVHTSTAVETGRFSGTGGRIISGHPRHGAHNNNDVTNVNVQPSTIPLFRRTEDPSTYETTNATSIRKSGEQGTVTNFHMSEEQDSRVNAEAGTYIEKEEHHFDSLATPKTGKQESIVPYYHSMTSTDVILLIVIAIILMLISIVITAVSCYCWLRRGKSVRGQKVNVVSSKTPSNAWAYHDMMPSSTLSSTAELRPLVKDTPPQSRKLMTCV